MKHAKTVLLLVLFLILFPLTLQTADAQAFNAATKANPYVYKFLAPMPGLFGSTIDVRNGLGAYLDKLYTAGIAIATGLAVIMIVFGGIEYVGSGTIGGKSDGKQRIQDALIGLLLAFMSYLLLNTINPDLLKNDLVLEGTQALKGTLNSQGLPTNSDNLNTVANRDEINRLTEELNNPNTTAERKNEIIKRIEEVSSGINSGSAAFINSIKNISSRSTDGGLNVTSYGSKFDTTPDDLTKALYGNNNNQIVPGSAALSPDLISKYNPKPGSSVYINGSFVGYYDDSTADTTGPKHGNIPIVNTIDVYDPNGVYGSGVLKGINSNNWQITFGPVRTQTPHN